MAQLSLYIDDETFEKIRARAKEEGLSLSKYANRVLENDLNRNGWPEGFWDLYGALADTEFALAEDPAPNDTAEFEEMFS